MLRTITEESRHGIFLPAKSARRYPASMIHRDMLQLPNVLYLLLAVMPGSWFPADGSAARFTQGGTGSH